MFGAKQVLQSWVGFEVFAAKTALWKGWTQVLNHETCSLILSTLSEILGHNKETGKKKWKSYLWRLLRAILMFWDLSACYENMRRIRITVLSSLNFQIAVSVQGETDT